MLAIWQPWEDRISSDSRTVEVTGEATIKSEPDEFVFYPSYQFNNTDKAIALQELTKKSEEIIAALKKLSVPDNKIKTDSNGYQDYSFYRDETTGKNNYYLNLTVSAASRDEATKIQDYLITTSPSGSVSPQATSSEKKRKELEQQARNEATKDARAKADQSAQNLGFKVGSVKSVNDGAGFNPIPYYDRGATLQSGSDKSIQSNLAVQPGENDLTYSVTVIYFVK